MKNRLKDFLIVIPLHLPLGYPCDYIDQTATILKQRNLIVFFDFRYPYSWKEIFLKKKLRFIITTLINFFKLRTGSIYFRPIAMLPFQSNSLLYRLNKIFGVLQIRLLSFFLKKKQIVWSFHPMINELKDYFGKIRFIYDCIDYLGDTPSTNIYLKEEKNFFRTADLVVFNSAGLAQVKTADNPLLNKFVVTVCGCNLDLFQKSIKTIPPELAAIRGKKVIFTGIFDFRLDFKLLDFVVKNNRNAKFIMIGPVDIKIQTEFSILLESNKNIIYLGKKDKKFIPSYLQHSDIGIIPYKTSLNYVKYGNPMKTYEYLASGIPVMATNILALKNFPSHIVYTTDDYQEFSDKLKYCLEKGNGKIIKKAKSVAKLNSWKKKIIKIELSLLNNF